MYQAIGIIELKSIAKGIEATDAALKSALSAMALRFSSFAL